jgi:hypothetical protein
MEHNGLYDSGRNLFALGSIKWKPNGSIVKAILVDPTKYTPDLANHSVITDISEAAIIFSKEHDSIENMPKLSLVTATAGICDADDIKFKLIQKGSKIGYLVLFLDDKHKSLICCCNIGGSANFIKSTGRPIIISWSNSENKIFKL